MNPEWIVLHHFVSPNDEDVGIQKRRLKAVLSQNPDPYHYVVFSDGSWWMLHSPTKPIGHCGSDNIESSKNGATNFNSIGICAMGNFEMGSMSSIQKGGLTRLLAKLCVDFEINPTKQICRHFDVVGRGVTACPGRFYPFDETIKKTTEIVKSRIELFLSSHDAILGGKPVELNSPPQVLWGKAIVGARDFLEGLSYDVIWDQNNKTVTAIKTGSIISLSPGKPTIWVDGAEKEMSEYPINLWGTVVLPVRSFLERLGYCVSWDEDSRKIIAVKNL
ncbi:MAG TPA: stalk domain-containing protein [Caldisericia bacterium]|nr:stalk domain-containing protein [Caldisericia bacterium]HPF49268.1 stalk domain-containing protein [Caldisericia bacterium]HPI84052.1 stalk domain-containing protein [Caldisericia bacterium]HPQ93310.1 stalk domain-containing protein [Caldisericia bacterium]HRV75308.1 stalk domain-containing protein [Caldisericia bacterium]